MALNRSLSATEEIEVPVLESPPPSTKNIQQRRSSFLSRGKRVSSLRFGSLGLPHPTINAKNFYLHIQADLPMPARMKTLLVWSMHRNIERQESVHAESLQLVKQVENELVKDIMGGEVNTSWYSRPKENAKENNERLPNPINLDNKLKLTELQYSISRYSKEDKAWRAASDAFRSAKRHKLSTSVVPDSTNPAQYLDATWQARLQQLENTISLENLPDSSIFQDIDFKINDTKIRVSQMLRESQQFHAEYKYTLMEYRRQNRDPWLYQFDAIWLLRSIADLLPVVVSDEKHDAKVF